MLSCDLVSGFIGIRNIARLNGTILVTTFTKYAHYLRMLNRSFTNDQAFVRDAKKEMTKKVVAIFVLESCRLSTLFSFRFCRDPRPRAIFLGRIHSRNEDLQLLFFKFQPLFFSRQNQ